MLGQPKTVSDNETGLKLKLNPTRSSQTLIDFGLGELSYVC